MSEGKGEDGFKPSLFSSLSLGTGTNWTSVIRAAALGTGTDQSAQSKLFRSFHEQQQKSGQPPITGPLDTPYKLQAYLGSCPPDLRELDLRGRQIKSLTRVQFPPGLESLELADNQIESLEGIQFPINLITLTLQNNKIKSLERVVFPDGLESLELADNQIDNLYNIKFPVGLNELDLSSNKIESLFGAEFPPNLDSLDLNDNPLDVVYGIKNPNKYVMEYLKRNFSSLYFRDVYDRHKELKMTEKLELKDAKQTEQATLKEISDFNQQSMQNQLRGITSFLREGMEARAQQHAKQLRKEREEKGRAMIEVRIILNGIQYPVPVPLNTANSVQSVLDYINEHYYISSLVPNCGAMHLYKSDGKSRLKLKNTLAHYGVQNNNTLNAQCHMMQLNPQGGGNQTKRNRTIKNKIKKSKKQKKWSLKYKKSINCKRPRGFSQRQYCKYGRK